MGIEKIRPVAVAGAFYPSDKAELERIVTEFLAEAKEISLAGTLKGLIEPHAGYIYSGSTAADGYKLLHALDKSKNWKVFLLGPSHQLYFDGAATIEVDFWETPLGNVKQSKLTRELIQRHPEVIKNIPQAHLSEHCLEVQLPFLLKVLKKFEIVPILTGEVEPEKLTEILLDYAQDDTLFMVSSDLSHYYPYEEAVKIDELANENIPELNIEKTKQEVEACGKVAILTLMHLARELNWKGKFISYRNSGDTAGDRSQVVGYGCYGFWE